MRSLLTLTALLCSLLAATPATAAKQSQCTDPYIDSQDEIDRVCLRLEKDHGSVSLRIGMQIYTFQMNFQNWDRTPLKEINDTVLQSARYFTGKSIDRNTGKIRYQGEITGFIKTIHGRPGYEILLRPVIWEFGRKPKEFQGEVYPYLKKNN